MPLLNWEDMSLGWRPFFCPTKDPSEDKCQEERSRALGCKRQEQGNAVGPLERLCGVAATMDCSVRSPVCPPVIPQTALSWNFVTLVEKVCDICVPILAL